MAKKTHYCPECGAKMQRVPHPTTFDEGKPIPSRYRERKCPNCPVVQQETEKTEVPYFKRDDFVPPKQRSFQIPLASLFGKRGPLGHLARNGV